MSHRITLSSLVVAAVLATAGPAPVASARPADEPLRPTTAGAVLKDARQLDMHASTVVKPVAPKQDLRSEATIDTPALNPQTHAPVATQDLRTEAAADKAPAPAPPVGMPTWPVDPEPIVPVAQEPVAATDAGDGLDWPLSGILLAGAALLGGTLGVAVMRHRVGQSHA